MGHPIIVNEDQGTDQSYTNFYRKLEDILDLMAPYRKLTQKEIKLQTMPWITRGILVSMKVRDKLYKQIKLQKQEAERDILSYRYKRYRNIIINLLRLRKKDYYSSFFEEHQGNVRKTWEGIRTLINVSKKKSALPTKLFHGNKIKSTELDIAN